VATLEIFKFKFKFKFKTVGVGPHRPREA